MIRFFLSKIFLVPFYILVPLVTFVQVIITFTEKNKRIFVSIISASIYNLSFRSKQGERGFAQDENYIIRLLY